MIGQDPAFKKLEQPHIRVHDLARRAVKEVNDGDRVKAEQTLQEIGEASREVVFWMNELRNKLIQKRNHMYKHL